VSKKGKEKRKICYACYYIVSVLRWWAYGLTDKRWGRVKFMRLRGYCQLDSFLFPEKYKYFLFCQNPIHVWDMWVPMQLSITLKSHSGDTSEFDFIHVCVLYKCDSSFWFWFVCIDRWFIQSWIYQIIIKTNSFPSPILDHG
jgi:hypothetical protein